MSSRLIALVIVLVSPLGLYARPLPKTTGLPQTPEQQAVCNRRHISLQRCGVLAVEFSKTNSLLKINAAPTLDDSSTSNRAFASEIGPLASAQIIQSDLEKELKLDAEAALQSLSTSAAVTQTGGAVSSTGSTNLVSKPTTTDLISLAAESGAFTDTVNGTTATLQANALGLAKYVENVPVFQRWDSSIGVARIADQLQPLNFTVTLNVAQSGASSLVPSGSANSVTPASIASILLPSNDASFSSFGVTYNVYRRYNPQDKAYLALWVKAVLDQTPGAQVATNNIRDAVTALTVGLPVDGTDLQTALAEWHASGAAAERATDKRTSFDDFVVAYMAYDKVYCGLVMKQQDAAKNVEALVHSLASFQDAVYAMVNEARGTPLATLGYTYSTPVQKPATHDFTAVGSYLFKGTPDGSQRSFMSGVQITGNFTASIFETVPAGANYGRFKDVQLSSEIDKPFGGTTVAPRGIFSLAGYGQYQYSPTVLNITAGNLAPGTNITLPSNAQVLLGTAGWLGIVQGKLVINLKQGLNIPVAVKWSNKTDLLQANDIRGQIGLSYDLSALTSLITGK